MRKIYALLSLFLIFIVNEKLDAQAVSGYVFAPSAGTYTALTGTTTSTATGDDGTQNVPLGFSFVFGGVAYSNAVISTNGAIKLAVDGTTGFGASWTNALGNAYGAPIIAPAWDDNNASGGSVYSTDGGATYTNLITYLGGATGPLNTGGSSLGSFTPGAEQWAEKTVDLPIGTNRIRFRGVSAFGNNLYLDNISVQPTPSCLPVTGVVNALAVSPTTVIVSFNSPGTAFVVEYGAPGFTPGTTNTPGVGGTVVFGASSPITVNGLAAGTTYDFYVRRICIPGVDFSTNKKATATTLCAATNIPYVQNFETSTPLIGFPTCTSMEDVNGNSGPTPNTGGGRWITNNIAQTYVSPTKSLWYIYDLVNPARADAAAGVGPTGTVSDATGFNQLYSVGNGNWTIAMRDYVGFDAGTLTSWSITITYQFLNPAVTWTPVSGLFTNSTATTAYTAGTDAPTVYAKPTGTTVYTATATGSGGCTTSATATVTVNPLPVIALGAIPDTVCISDGVIQLPATPVGGNWTGIGVSGNTFIPTATAVGTYTLTYSYTNASGCSATTTKRIAVKDCPERIRLLRDDALVLYPNPNLG
ncbi:hypothetical protein OSTOST_09264, partial [Ostertagia ostertagi]